MAARLPLSRAHLLGICAAALLALAALALLALVLNPRGLHGGQAPSLTTTEAVTVLLGGGDEWARAIVWGARLPRVMLAGLVGAALALAGALLQSVLRNPLADPFVLGVSSGAALAAVAALATGLVSASGGHAVAAAMGALVAALIVVRLGRDSEGQLAPERLVLAGVVLSYLFSAGIMWVVALSSAEAGQRYVFWLMGSMASASGRDAVLCALVLAVGAVLAWPTLSALNLIQVAEEHAADSGVDVERTKWFAVLSASLLVGGSVAVAGSIGFVGLIVPHGVRFVFGSDARRVAPLSAIAGAAFVILADFGSRALGEVPLGVLTATVGGPAFLLLLARRRRG